MSPGTRAAYLMNPAEDEMVLAADLEAGMLVLAECEAYRIPSGGGEDERLRAQRFRRIVRFLPADIPHLIRFIGEWVDGYQMVHTFSRTEVLLVKKDTAAPGEQA